MMLDDENLVVFSALSCQLGKRRVFENLSGCFKRGSIVGVWGPNGIGKTTLLELLADWRLPTQGRIEWKEGLRLPFLVPTNPNLLLFPWYRVEMSLLIYARLASDRGHSQEELGNFQEELTNSLDLKNLLTRRPFELSSGERARAAIACALLFRPSLLMLDEIFTRIDVSMQKTIAGVLKSETSVRRTSLLLVSHAISPIFLTVDYVWQFGSNSDFTLTNRDAFLNSLRADMTPPLL